MGQKTPFAERIEALVEGSSPSAPAVPDRSPNFADIVGGMLNQTFRNKDPRDSVDSITDQVAKALMPWPEYNPEIWYNADRNVLFVSPGDWEAPGTPQEGDDWDAYPDWDTVEQLLISITGVDVVMVEPESAPGETDAPGKWYKLEWKKRGAFPDVDPTHNFKSDVDVAAPEGPHGQFQWWPGGASGHGPKESLEEQRGYGDLEDALNDFYKSEYFYSRIKNGGWIGSDDKKRVMEDYANTVRESGAAIARYLEDVYDDWIVMHDWDDNNAWAKARVEDFWAHGLDFPNTVKTLINAGSRWAGNIWGNADPMQELWTVLDLQKFPSLRDVIERMREEDESFWDDDEQEYPYKTTEEFWESFQDIYYGDDMLDMLETHMTPSEQQRFTIDVWKNYTGEMFKDRFASVIPEALERIQETAARVAEVETGAARMRPEDVAVRINLGLNEAHTSGPMMDYVEDRYGVTKDDLDFLSNQDTEDWDEELRGMGVTEPGMEWQADARQRMLKNLQLGGPREKKIPSFNDIVEAQNPELFAAQDSTSERLVHDKRWPREDEYFRKRLEAAGDILREYAEPHGLAAWDYIHEKIGLLDDLLSDPSRTDWLLDSMHLRADSNNDVLEDLRQSYENLLGDVAMDERQQTAAQLVVAIASADWDSARSLLGRIKEYEASRSSGEEQPEPEEQPGPINPALDPLVGESFDSVAEKFATSAKTDHGYAEVFMNPSPKELRVVKPGARAWVMPDGNVYAWDYGTALHMEIARLLVKEGWEDEVLDGGVAVYMHPDVMAKRIRVELAPETYMSKRWDKTAEVIDAVETNPYMMKMFPAGVDVEKMAGMQFSSTTDPDGEDEWDLDDDPSIFGDYDESLDEANLTKEQWAELADGLGNSVDDVKEYYASMDPTGKRNKYASWIRKRHLDDNFDGVPEKIIDQGHEATSEFIKRLLSGFDMLKKQKKLKGPEAEIMNYTLPNLIATVSGPDAIDPIERLEHYGGEVVHQDPRWIVVHIPEGEAAEACGAAGHGARAAPWCTRFKSNFEHYSTDAGLHFIYSPKGSKVRPRKLSHIPGYYFTAAIGVHPDGEIEFQDAANSPIDPDWIAANDAEDLVEALDEIYGDNAIYDYLGQHEPELDEVAVADEAWHGYVVNDFTDKLEKFLERVEAGEVWSELDPKMVQEAEDYLRYYIEDADAEEMLGLFDAIRGELDRYGRYVTWDYELEYHPTENRRYWIASIDVEEVMREAELLIGPELIVYQAEPERMQALQKSSAEQSMLFPMGQDVTTPWELGGAGATLDYLDPETNQWKRAQVADPTMWRDDQAYILDLTDREFKHVPIENVRQASRRVAGHHVMYGPPVAGAPAFEALVKTMEQLCE